MPQQQRRWFGREPALVVQGVGAVVTMVVAFMFPALAVNTAALITALVGAVAATITALYVRPIAPTVFGGLIAAVTPLFAAFGWHFTQVQVGSLSAAVALGMAIATRPQQNYQDPVVVRTGRAARVTE